MNIYAGKIEAYFCFPFHVFDFQKAANVREALENFVNKDEVEGFTCAKTNQKVNAWQTMTLEKLPVVLVLHLKWFDYKADGCTKIVKTVEYPIELKLDASEYFAFKHIFLILCQSIL